MATTSVHRRSARTACGAALQFELQCDFASVRQGAVQLRAFLQGQDLLEPDIWACELAFVEACNNLVQHTPLVARLQPFGVRVNRTADEVELEISDFGPGFDLPERSDLPALDQENGRGLFLIRSVMSHVEYVRAETGNHFLMRLKVHSL